MKNQDYQMSFTTNTSAKEAFENIINVGEWWTSSFKGNAKNLNGEFKVTFGKTTVNFKVIESVPYKKFSWLVTDCYLDWLKNKTEWKDTKLVWNISEEKDVTKIKMTHVGLIPDMECYNDCKTGWDQYAGESLPKLIASGNGVIFEGSKG